jgi:antitoxin HicB
MKNKHLGTGFDEFLEQEGLQADTEAVAIKRVIAYQIEQEMERAKISKSAIAAKMHPREAVVAKKIEEVIKGNGN